MVSGDGNELAEQFQESVVQHEQRHPLHSLKQLGERGGGGG